MTIKTVENVDLLKQQSSLFAMAMMLGGGYGGFSERVPRVISGEVYKKNQGQRFVYSDGFECWALNKKNADKKYIKFLNDNNNK